MPANINLALSTILSLGLLGLSHPANAAVSGPTAKCRNFFSVEQILNKKNQSALSLAAEIKLNPDTVIEASKLIKDLRDDEQSIKNSEDFTGRLKTTAKIKERNRFVKMLLLLTRGDAESAVSEYRLLFHDVEMSYWQMQSLPKLITTLDAQISVVSAFESTTLRSQRKTLQKQLKQAKIRLGENFNEYSDVRTYLEQTTSGVDADYAQILNQNMPNANLSALVVSPDAKKLVRAQTAQNILKNLGIRNIDTLFPQIHLGNRNIDLGAIRASFDSCYECTKAMLNKLRTDEVATGLKIFLFTDSILGLLDKAIDLLPTQYRLPLKDWQPMAQLKRIKLRIFPLIDQLEDIDTGSPQADIEAQLESAWHFNASTKDNEFLIVLAQTDPRLFDTLMAAQAAKRDNTKSVGDTNYYNLMDTAAKTATTRGPMSRLIPVAQPVDLLGLGLKTAVWMGGIYLSTHPDQASTLYNGGLDILTMSYHSVAQALTQALQLIVSLGNSAP